MALDDKEEVFEDVLVLVEDTLAVSVNVRTELRVDFIEPDELSV